MDRRIFRALADDWSRNLEKVIVGKREALELIVIGLLCEGHVLIEDVPGVGKTMLARSLARSLDCDFNRIQFTPDMLPSDITGVSIYNQQKGKFEFRAGPDHRPDHPGRRNQPGHAENPGRAAGGDGRTASHCGWINAHAAASVHGPGDAESDRVRRNIPAARSPTGPLPAAESGWGIRISSTRCGSLMISS